MVLSTTSKRALTLFLLRKRRKRRAEYWVHPLNTRRLECGEYHRLCQELETYPARYFQYFRMSRNQFEKLHNMLADEISKENTNYRDAISSRERLVVTLRYRTTDAHLPHPASPVLRCIRFAASE
ncbi:hypothetical protein NQ314_012422 [Rhamnusium bicolor]|uniref:Uncharacterized protein n=1 Tax=Rhamnusium bicolor TaxID=1586634 RepID=A0AAV8XCV7_9CUCU|nr:hypothetical protein NQ314_012422 [Rhamnusium bicolor]